MSVMRKRGSSCMLVDLCAAQAAGNASGPTLYPNILKKLCTRNHPETGGELPNACSSGVDDRNNDLTGALEMPFRDPSCTLTTVDAMDCTRRTSQETEKATTGERPAAGTMEAGGAAPLTPLLLRRAPERDLLLDIVVDPPSPVSAFATSSENGEEDSDLDTPTTPRGASPEWSPDGLTSTVNSPDVMVLDHTPCPPNVKEMHRNAKRKMSSVARALRASLTTGSGDGGEENKRIRSRLLASFLDETTSWRKTSAQPMDISLGAEASPVAGAAVEPRSAERVLFPMSPCARDLERRRSPELSGRWLR